MGLLWLSLTLLWRSADLVWGLGRSPYPRRYNTDFLPTPSATRDLLPGSRHATRYASPKSQLRSVRADQHYAGRNNNLLSRGPMRSNWMHAEPKFISDPVCHG